VGVPGGFRARFRQLGHRRRGGAGGQKRLLADPARLDEVEGWTTSDHMWTRRAALVFTLGFAKSRHPGAVEQAARDRVLGWCAAYADDPDWFIQKAVAWWVRDLSKKDPERAQAFLETHGARLKPWASRSGAAPRLSGRFPRGNRDGKRAFSAPLRPAARPPEER
jgi:hypothetical protein